MPSSSPLPLPSLRLVLATKQGTLWCGSDESQLSESVELVPPTTLEGTDTVVVFREATMSGSPSYTVEGLVQIVGSGSIVDDALIITHSLRCVRVSVCVCLCVCFSFH